MILFLALLTTLSGAVLVYLSCAQQRLREHPLPAASRWAGGLLVAMGTACWWYDAGMGPGITAALTLLMLSWVALPYLSWWRASALTVDEP